MKWFISRLKEPSTWAGFALIAPSIASLAVDKNNPAAWGQAAGGLAAVLVKEKGEANGT